MRGRKKREREETTKKNMQQQLFLKSTLERFLVVTLGKTNFSNYNIHF